MILISVLAAGDFELNRAGNLIASAGVVVALIGGSIALWDRFTERRSISNIDDLVEAVNRLASIVQGSDSIVSTPEGSEKLSEALSNLSRATVERVPDASELDDLYVRIYTGVFSLRHNTSKELELPDGSSVVFGFGGFGNTETLLVRLNGEDAYLPGGGIVSVGDPALGCNVALLSFELDNTEGKSVANFRFRCNPR